MRLINYFFVVIAIVLAKGALSQVKVIPAITHVKCIGGTDGVINLTPAGTGTPYTYTWQPGSIYTSNITNRGVGNYTVTVKNTSASTITASYNIGYKANWTNLYPGLVVIGDELIQNRSDHADTWLEGAYTSNILPPSTNGWIEYVITNTGFSKAMGLLDVPGAASSGYTDIDYGIMFNAGGSMTRINSGSFTSISTTYTVGDVIRIERAGNTIIYSKNRIGFDSETVPSAMVLQNWVAKGVIYNYGAKLENIGCSFTSLNLVADAGVDAFVASGASVSLGGSPTASMGSGSYSYNWIPSTSYSPSSTNANPTIIASASTLFTVTVTDLTTGCIKTDDKLVYIGAPFYVVLKKILDAGYCNSLNQKLYFTFNEEYVDPALVLNYKIVNDKNQAISVIPGLVENIGDNRYALNLSSISGLTVGQFYRISITNKKNEVYSARFKY